jgi:ATP-dependent Zn protease
MTGSSHAPVHPEGMLSRTKTASQAAAAAPSSVRDLVISAEAAGSPDELADGVLRVLARKATGLSGADVERLVREARQTARRERRPLSFADIESRLAASRPDKPESLRRRVALHEAGHAIARMSLGLGGIDLITIDGPGGNGMVLTDELPLREETEALLEAMLVAKLAGRAAEEELLGSCVAGSGGSSASDLGSATALALKMEVAFGFGREAPLLYRDADQHAPLLLSRPDVAIRVNARLERAYAEARKLILSHQAAVEALAVLLLQIETIEGPELTHILEQLTA